MALIVEDEHGERWEVQTGLDWEHVRSKGQTMAQLMEAHGKTPELATARGADVARERAVADLLADDPGAVIEAAREAFEENLRRFP